MLAYNQSPEQSLFNHSPLEVPHSNNTFDAFLKQYSNEKVVKRKLNVGDIVWINGTSNSFEKKNHLWSTELFKVSKVLDTKSEAFSLREMKDKKRFLVVFTSKNYKSKNHSTVSNWKDIKESNSQG